MSVLSWSFLAVAFLVLASEYLLILEIRVTL